MAKFGVFLSSVEYPKESLSYLIIFKTMKGKNKEHIDRLKKRNEAMRKDYSKLKLEGFRSEKIIRVISEKFYLATATVEDIVYQNGVYKDS